MELCYFDLIVGTIVLLLGLKGLLNGFFKELFGLIGIIGGIFVASRFGAEVGTFVSDALFHFENESAVSFTGFLVTLAIFWAVMIGLGMLFKKLSSASGLGMVDRLFGFLIGSGKFFLIGAVIMYALFNINAVRSKLEGVNERSILFPVMVEVGGYIMKLDPVEMAEEAGANVEAGTEAIKTQAEKVTEAITDTAKEVIEQDVVERTDMIIERTREQFETNETTGEN